MAPPSIWPTIGGAVLTGTRPAASTDLPANLVDMRGDKRGETMNEQELDTHIERGLDALRQEFADTVSGTT